MEKPSVWNYRHQLLALKQKFSRLNWDLEWCSRKANALVDSISKFSYQNNSNLFFDPNAFCNDPFFFCPGIIGIIGEASLFLSFV